MADLPINAMTGKTFDPTLPMFHGTSSAFNLGDVIAPAEVAGVPSVHNSELLPNLTSNAFATQDIDRARAYAEKAAKRSGGSPLVYRVEPVDLTNLAFDMDAPDDSSWMSSKGFRVVSPAEKEAAGKTAVDFANGSIHYAPDGRSYFLHHSPNSTIEIGEKIRTTGLKQVTAGDAIQGYSYAWDARTGLGDAVANQVSERGGFGRVGPSALPYEDVVTPATDEFVDASGPKTFSVYLTAADSASVYPDLNVPESAARAIKGEQQVLDKITIPANLSDEDATDLVRKMTRKHGIFEANDKSVREMINSSVLASRGEEVLGNFLEGHGEGVIKGHIKNIEKQIAEGGRKGMYVENKTLPHLAQLGAIFESEGPDAAYAFAKKTFTADAMGLDTSKLSAKISNKAIGTTQAMIDKAIKAEELIRSAQGRTRLLETSMDASAAVAGGIAKSGLLRDAAAAATILGKRF